ncbi:hypothetical protein Tco_0070228, partial [Tanacetum coccineum]
MIIKVACAAHPTTDVFINFASFRRVVAIIAKGVPDSDTKELISYARSNNK